MPNGVKGHRKCMNTYKTAKFGYHLNFAAQADLFGIMDRQQFIN